LKKALIVIGSVLFLDQLLKLWVKTHMIMGQEINVLGNWFVLHFTENQGMAFGMVLGGDYGKLALSLFRIVAVVLLGWYLGDLIKRKADTVMIVSISLIMAGALGNIIDSAVYGLIFSESYGQIARFMPADGGYAGFLHGRVVDMLYFPIIDTHLPGWLPIKPFPKPGWMPMFLYDIFPWANDHFMFFRAVFNIADSSITVGVAMILLFQRKFFRISKSQEKPEIAAASKPETVSEEGSGNRDEDSEQ